MPSLRSLSSMGLSLGGGGSGGAVIKAVQRGTSTIATVDSTLDVPITAVDLTKTFVHFTLNVGDVNAGDSQMRAIGELTTATNLRFRRWNGGSAALSFDWEVVEFLSGVNVQQIGGPLTGTNVTYTITAVNPAKTFLVSSWNDNSGNSASTTTYTWEPRVSLTSATTVRAIRNNASPNIQTDIKVFVVEFQ